MKLRFDLVHAGHNYFVIEARDEDVLAACVFITPKSKDGNEINAQVALHPDGPLWGCDDATMKLLTAEALSTVLKTNGTSHAQTVANQLLGLSPRADFREFVSCAIRLAAAVGVKKL